ncbi:MAG: hypothetical protein WD844_06205 [Thermoleophilaceae bacterium]
MRSRHPSPSFVLSLIALVMASAGTGYAALGDSGGAVTAGNARGEPVEIELRNRSRGETGLVTASDGYSLRLSNTQEGGGGGAVYGCRAPDAPPGDNVACLYADNLRGGKAFLFRSQEGPTVGHFDLGNPAGAPFTTNATGVVTNLNADKVDGLDAAQLQGATGPQGPAGPTGATGVQGPAGPTASAYGSSDTNQAFGGPTTLVQATITTTVESRIVANASASFNASEDTIDDQFPCKLELDAPATEDISQDYQVYVPENSTPALGGTSASFTGAALKPAGTYTVRLECAANSGSPTFDAGDITLIAVAT